MAKTVNSSSTKDPNTQVESLQKLGIEQKWGKVRFEFKEA